MGEQCQKGFRTYTAFCHHRIDKRREEGDGLEEKDMRWLKPKRKRKKFKGLTEELSVPNERVAAEETTEPFFYDNFCGTDWFDIEATLKELNN